MPLVRFLAVFVAVLALGAPPASARVSTATKTARTMKAPTDLHAFLPGFATGTTTFPRTPAFVWNPARGAARYELVLSTDPNFAGNAIVWDDTSVKTPVAAVPIALPWITGAPHSLYARVRGIAANGTVGSWSATYGFDMRWMDDGMPTQLSSQPGLVRWEPVDGATGYEVWFQNAEVVDANGNPAGAAPMVYTTTNSADERDYYTFHQPLQDLALPPEQWTVEWRVRAVRSVYGTLNNALPTVSYGPWSDVYTNANPALETGDFRNLQMFGEPAVPGHDPWQDGFRLTPAFTFDGDSGTWGPASLYRVYVFSDKDCTNPVFKGSVIGSPAYSPRTSLPLALPTDPATLAKLEATPWLPDSPGFVDYPLIVPTGVQQSYAVDNVTTPVDERELQAPASFSPTLIAPPASSGASSSTSSGPTAPPTSSSGATTGTLTGNGAPTGLWDSNWPVGRYYWTVVAVRAEVLGGASSHVRYVDEELPQDVCREDTGREGSGRIASFGTASQPPTTFDPVRHVPYVWGLSTNGRLRSASAAKPTVAGSPLVAWQPAVPATAYEVQWSKSAYPWRPYGNLYTYSTSTTLPLKPGRWYYRVRGINMTLPTGASTMAWSPKVGLVIAKPKFKIGK